MKTRSFLSGALILALAVLAPFAAFAQSDKLSSTASLPSLVLGPEIAGGSTAALSVARGEGAFALDNNVAAMPFSSGKLLDAAVAYSLWMPSLTADNYVSAGVTFKPIKSLGIGLSFRDRIQKPYQITTDSGSDSRDGTFKPGEFNCALGVSYAFLPYLSAGVSLRLLRSSLAPSAAGMAFGTDIALAYRQAFGRNVISAGLSANNLGTKIKYGENAYAQPSLLKAGAAYSYLLGGKDARSSHSSLTAAAEFDLLFAGGMMASAGLEYGFKDMVFVRAGYHYGDSQKAVPSFANVGVGLKFFGVSLNAAYLFGSENLGNSFSVSLGYSF